MISERQTGLIAIHTAIQSLVLIGTYLIWIFVCEGIVKFRLAGNRLDYSIYAFAMIIALILVTLISKNFEKDIVRGGWERRIRHSFRQAVSMVACLVFFLVATKDVTISRAFLFSFIPVLFLVLAMTNLLVPEWLMRRVFSGQAAEPCLLLSWPEEEAEGLASHHLDLFEKKTFQEWLTDQTRFGVHFVGLLGKDERLQGTPEIKELGEIGDLSAVLRTSGARSLLMLNFPARSTQLNSIIEICETKGVHLSILHDLQVHFGRPVIFRETNGMHLLQFRREPLQNPLYRIIKRLFDLAVASLVILLILPPVALSVWLMQKMQAPGPLFYRQERSGRGNKPFMIWKFRSMYCDGSDERKPASRGDSRVFPFGRFIRHTSLDELPQFLNVIGGEMSVVGPRPHLAAHNELWEQLLRPYQLRSRVKPGITGLAQIRGLRGEVNQEIDIRRRIECDLEYIEKWSFLLDLSLVVATAFQIIFPKQSAF
jgi:exopolysaccharide biosynthesis polyprenyl glycosylphosphotransferase